MNVQWQVRLNLLATATRKDGAQRAALICDDDGDQPQIAIRRLFSAFERHPNWIENPMSNVVTEAGTVVEIVGVNILLSADNAILVALACRNLPDTQRRLGILLGASGSIVLRIALAVAVAKLLDVHFLTLVGGLFVIYLAAKLPNQGFEPPQVAANRTLFKAVASIIVADVLFSLDNALALNAAANGSVRLVIFGLLLSGPTIMLSAGLLTSLMNRLPILIWFGAAVLGWAGGQLVARDPAFKLWALTSPLPEAWIAALGAAVVILWATFAKMLTKRESAKVGRS
jgi:YjbE family integral membrane protein